MNANGRADKADLTRELVYAVRRLGDAITPNVVGCQDAAGGHVESLTEAVMGVTAGLVRIADALEELADAVRSARQGPCPWAGGDET
jgi:hypothetical protein